MIDGLKCTTLGYTLTYAIVHQSFIQMMNISENWQLTISSIDFQPYHAIVFDSMPVDICLPAEQLYSVLKTSILVWLFE